MDRFDVKQLYAIASTGKVKMWTGWVTKNPDGTATMWTRHGYKDGNLTETPKIYKEGKNIGKSNETTPFEQAISELKSKYDQKMAIKNYRTNLDDMQSNVIVGPMLAHPYTKRKHNIKWPCFVQPKLNGVRCLVTRSDQDTLIYKSRNGKDYTTLKHLDAPLKMLLEIGETLDGEIFHPDMSFQEIVRRVKKQRKDSDLLQYWIFDLVNTRLPQLQRKEELDVRMMGWEFKEIAYAKNIVNVSTELAYSEMEMKECFSKFIEAGFEGIMLRNLEGFYKCSERTPDLQKYKEFIDEEFRITGYDKEIVAKKNPSTGEIKQTPLVVWTCITPEGKAFNVRPKGSEDKRAKWYSEATNIVGKNLTVRYQELSEDKVPIFPVGIAIRDYE